MADALADGAHRFTAEQYFVAATAADWGPTELIEGVIYDLSPEHLLHARTSMAIALALTAALPDLEVVAR